MLRREGEGSFRATYCSFLLLIFAENKTKLYSIFGGRLNGSPHLRSDADERRVMRSGLLSSVQDSERCE